ncbi:hypothetical protein IKS86_05525 [bacterium]|nr:hypothetical protein [bacterium]
MKKVSFIFAIFAAMFLVISCGSKDLLDAANTDANDQTDTVDTDATDQTDTATDPNDPNNQNDPNDPNNQNDPNDPNNQNDPNDPNNQNDPNDPNNQNDPNDPNNQNDPNDPNNQNDPNDPNDTDANDTDVNDTDSNDTDSNDTDVNDTDTNASDTTNDPCTDPNPCETIDHSDGVCTATEAESEELFTCGCESDILGNYMWYDGKCRQVVTKHQCQVLAEFVQENFGVPEWVTDVVEFVCHCFTDECVIIWEP